MISSAMQQDGPRSPNRLSKGSPKRLDWWLRSRRSWMIVTAFLLGTSTILVGFGRWQVRQLPAQLASEFRYYNGVVVEQRVALPWLSSASGMAPLGPDRWLVAGDDASELNVIDGLGICKLRVPLPDQQNVDEDGRVPKAFKRDFEAVASWQTPGEQWRFLVLGSGSKIPERCFILYGSWADEKLSFQEFEASTFYEKLLLRAKMLPESLNVEGAVVMHERLVLLNREDNRVFCIHVNEFVSFLENQEEELAIEAGQLTLPSFAGVPSGFSGACTDASGDRLYLSASFEDRSGTLQDGQILGSSIGWSDLGDALAPNEIETYHLVNAAGERSFDKLEALEILSQDSSGMRLVGVTDSDDGGSFWLQIFVPASYLPRKPALPFARKP